MKFKPKTGKIELGKFGEPLNKPKDVIPKRKPDIYTGHQQVLKSGKSRTSSEMKVKPASSQTGHQQVLKSGKSRTSTETKVKPDAGHQEFNSGQSCTSTEVKTKVKLGEKMKLQDTGPHSDTADSGMNGLAIGGSSEYQPSSSDVSISDTTPVLAVCSGNQTGQMENQSSCSGNKSGNDGGLGNKNCLTFTDMFNKSLDFNFVKPE